MCALPRLLLLLSAFACAGAPLRADVIVVDPGGHPGAARLQAALDGAQPGDIVLVRAGDYTGQLLSVNGKAVSVIAERDAEVLLSGLSSFSPPGSPIVLRGLTVLGLAEENLAFNFNCEGPLWIEDCSGSPGPSTPGGLGAPVGLALQNGEAAAVVVRCSLRGGNGLDAPGGPEGNAQGGGAGLQVSFGESIAVLEVTAVGGSGGDGPSLAIFGAHGAAGTYLAFLGQAFVMGGSFTGGDEGADNQAAIHPGAGILASFVNPLHLRGAVAVAGQVNGAGTPVLPVTLGLSTLVEFPAAPRSLEVSSPVRELASAAFTVQGQPGDVAFAFVSLQPGATLVPGKQGLFLLDASNPVASVPLGSVSEASGLLTGAVPMPRLPTGIDGLILYTQLGVVSAGGEALLGSGSAVVWLSALL
jgi:hypothetical protein